MSHDDRDKAGGHARRKSDFQCRCCDGLQRRERSRGRTRRNRAINKYERRAEGTS